MLAIESFNVSKIYKNSNKKALNDISLQIEKGKISTLLGRNGAGKTTFIRICSTQLLPTSGRILVFGDDIIKSPEKIRQKNFDVFKSFCPCRFAFGAEKHKTNKICLM